LKIIENNKDNIKYVPLRFISELSLNIFTEIIDEKEEECSICFENEGKWCKIKNCGHIIHYECFKKCVLDQHNIKCLYCMVEIIKI
jgi:hypothetical protein